MFVFRYMIEKLNVQPEEAIVGKVDLYCMFSSSQI